MNNNDPHLQYLYELLLQLNYNHNNYYLKANQNIVYVAENGICGKIVSKFVLSNHFTPGKCTSSQKSMVFNLKYK